MLAILAGIIALVGTGLNILTILHIVCNWYHAGKCHAYRLCSLSLSISDTILSAILLPLAATRFYCQAWIFGITSCLAVYGTVTWVLFNLIFIAVFRCVKLQRSLATRQENPRVIIAIIIFIMCMSYLFPFLAFMEVWGTIQVKPTNPTICTIMPDHLGHTAKPLIWILGVFIPIAIIYSASAILYYNVHQQRKKCLTSNQQHRVIMRLRNTLFHIMGSFLIGYQPILILNTVDNEKTRLPAELHIFSMILAWLTTILHPFVYFYRPFLDRRRLTVGPPRKQSTRVAAKEGIVVRKGIEPQPTPSTEVSPNPDTKPIWRIQFAGQQGSQRIDMKFMNSDADEVEMDPIPPPLLPKNEKIPSCSRVHVVGTTTTLLLSLITMSSANITRAVIYESIDHFPPAIAKLPVCEGFMAPLTMVSTCISTAYWIGIRPDASVCAYMRGCSGQMVGNDGSNCEPLLPTCNLYKMHPTFIDPLTCQSRKHVQGHTPPHIMLKDVLPEYCSVGNLHLRNCLTFKEEIALVPVLLIRGIIHPVTELHISEDAGLSDITSYNCSCNPDTCISGPERKCHGDTTFCAHIGCAEEYYDINESQPCYCAYAIHDMIHIYNAPTGQLTPDCWGHLPMVVKVATHPTNEFTQCDTCSLTCTSAGQELHTPKRIPKYIKVLKNPGSVSVVPYSETTVINLTTHMLISHGKTTVEIWFAEADYPITLEQTCPRLNVCQVITCHLCYDRWINVACYDIVNWGLLIIFILVITTIVIVTRKVTRMFCCLFGIITWPCRKVWKYRYQQRQQTLPVSEKESILPLTQQDSPNPYRTTTSPVGRRTRSSNFRYKGPLIFIITLCGLVMKTEGCSEFASLSASSTECRYGHALETCQLQLNTRLAVSPIGQKSCFKISNHQQHILGTVEFETGEISVQCNKQVLYFVPRPHINCQSHIQCYSLYSSSDCHGNKCEDFKQNDTVEAISSTKDSLGWSSCLAVRYPTCLFWLTRDCHFMRAALVNPTHESYEVFNCPTWHYSAVLKIVTRLSGKSTTATIRLRVGERQAVSNLNISLISTSIPPLPVLDHCFMKQQAKIALIPCNDRGEISSGRVGEIQCDKDYDAQSLSSNCIGLQRLISMQTDSTGVKCTGDLIDPTLLLKAHTLPVKLENGIIISTQDTVAFDTSASSLLEIQIQATDLMLTAEIQDGKCEATFIKLEGCYSCLSGAIIFIDAKSDSTDSITATLECPNNVIYTQFVVTNVSHNFQQIVQLETPEVNLMCTLKCNNVIDLHITGHLHYLSNANFLQHEDVVTHHGVITGGLDFHWMSVLGTNIYSWIFRSIVFLGIVGGAILIMFVAFRWTHVKTA